MRGSRWFVFTVVVSFCALWVIPAGAGGIVVSPVKIVAEVQEGAKLPPITIFNGSAEPISVEVSLGEGRHDLHGVPVVTSEISPNSPESPLSLNPVEFRLAPGRSQIVHARVRKPVGDGLYPVIYFSICGDGNKSGSVQAKRKLAVLTLLTAPHGKVPVPVVKDVFVSQSEKGAPIRMTSVVSNPGRRHLTVYGELLISNQEKAENARLSVHPVTILPGCSRQLKLVWHPEDLVEGVYRGALWLRTESGRKVEQAFSIVAVGPYEIAQPSLEISGWNAQATTLSGEVILEGVVRNGGNVPLSPTVEVEVLGVDDLSLQPVALDTLKPGETKIVQMPLPSRLEGGVYDLRVLVSARSQGRLVQQAATYQLKVEEANVVALLPILP